MSASGVSEVASVGGFVQEYQVDVDPDAMRAYNVKLDEVLEKYKYQTMKLYDRALRKDITSNLDKEDSKAVKILNEVYKRKMVDSQSNEKENK